ncbi:MAG: acetyl-CoA acetyltransferase, partial [Acidimicrobiia bacterium]
YVESVGDVLAAEEISSPLTVPMCCVITDGGGALVVASEAVAKSVGDRAVTVLGTGEAIGHGAPPEPAGFTTTAVSRSAHQAFGEAGVGPGEIDLCTIYDSFTITVITALEDAGFCAKGEGGAFVEGGRLGPGGSLPTNPDGGGLATNHPGMRGIFLVIEAVRQLRHEAGARQVPDAGLAFVQGVGGTIDSRHGAASLVLGR